MKKSPTYGMDFLTPTEASNRMRVSPITLRKWADKGLIQAQITAGGHRRYPLSEVERLLQRQSKPVGSPTKIMIVDDDLFISEILQDYLSRLSAPVAIQIASDGFEAGRKLLTFMPDIILLDLMMPGLDGFEVCRRVKSDPSSAHIRVIAVTGYPTEENIQRILSAGAEGCLAKPVEYAELLAALNLSEVAGSTSTRKSI